MKLFALKVVVVAYETRSSLTRGSKCSNLASKKPFDILENWSLRRGGCLQEVVATRGSTVFKTKLSMERRNVEVSNSLMLTLMSTNTKLYN